MKNEQTDTFRRTTIFDEETKGALSTIWYNERDEVHNPDSWAEKKFDKLGRTTEIAWKKYGLLYRPPHEGHALEEYDWESGIKKESFFFDGIECEGPDGAHIVVRDIETNEILGMYELIKDNSIDPSPL